MFSRGEGRLVLGCTLYGINTVLSGQCQRARCANDSSATARARLGLNRYRLAILARSTFTPGDPSDVASL